MKRKEEIKLEFFKQFGNESFRGYPLEQCHSIWDFFEKHIQCQEDMTENKYTEQDMLKAIEKARDIFDGKDCFTAEDVSGCTEVCTYNWKFQFSEDDIIKSLNKQD